MTRFFTRSSQGVDPAVADTLDAGRALLELDLDGLVHAATCQAFARTLAPLTESADLDIAMDAFGLSTALTAKAQRLVAARGLERTTWVWAARSFTAAATVRGERFHAELAPLHGARPALAWDVAALLPRMIEHFATALLDQPGTADAVEAAVDVTLMRLQLDEATVESLVRAVLLAVMRTWVLQLAETPASARDQVVVLAENPSAPTLTSMWREIPLLLAAAPELVELRPAAGGTRHHHVLARVPVEVARHLKSLTDAQGVTVLTASAAALPGDDVEVYRDALRYVDFAVDGVTGRYDEAGRTALAGSLRAALALVRTDAGHHAA